MALTYSKETELATLSIRVACMHLVSQIFRLRYTCDHYKAILRNDNHLMADWVVRLTYNHFNWGLRICYPYLLNLKVFKWNL